MTVKTLRMEAAGNTFVDWPREKSGYPIGEMIADDTFDNIGLRARWQLLGPGRSLVDTDIPRALSRWAPA